MGVWMRVADPSCKYSEFRTNLDKVDTRGPLEEMQRHGPAVGKRSLRTLSVHEHHKAETVAHLSNQAAAALALSSGEEYAMWTRALVKKLCETADSDRLRDICENLLYSDPRALNATTSWSPTVVGVHKLDLAESLVSIIAQHRKLQRLALLLKSSLDRRRAELVDPPG
eukprot:TRINITY_DN2892_c0_g1_i5.p1 TRINITY_DN2892_c0_g1~~TRINITY_DN2892_c0_g1_i5.p1  ORF type:complete len:169 (-),score=16.35 TRINITY_DN2892_c0_g1_i5:178-684(-)